MDRPANRPGSPGALPPRFRYRDAPCDLCTVMSIYVEILVRAPMDALWAHTQTPALHEQWDLRFSKID